MTEPTPEYAAAHPAEELPLATAPDAVPATYNFPPGTPDEVPADFAKAREDALASQLTPAEIAEFRALQQEKRDRDAAAAAEAAAAAAKLSPPTHYLTLADGSTVDGSTIETHVDTGHGLVPVAAAWPKPEFVSVPG